MLMWPSKGRGGRLCFRLSETTGFKMAATANLGLIDRGFVGKFDPMAAGGLRAHNWSNI